MLTSFAYGDAIGNEVVAIYDILKAEGYETEIYADSYDKRLGKIRIIKKIYENIRFDTSDIIIYHLSIGTQWNRKVFDFNAKVVIIYHNITPPMYLRGPVNNSWYNVERGLRDLQIIADKAKYCIAVSEFNKKCLFDHGFTGNIKVIPLLISFSDYEKPPSMEVIDRYSDLKGTKILFTGRIAPNKKIEDIISVFNEYKKYCDASAHLFLAGLYFESDSYYLDLLEYIRRLEIKDVIFTGHISFNELLSYYRIADCFLCMSEHEGFCVPLVEAMYFDIPVVAYDSKSAIKDTLGGSGFLLEKKDPLEIALIIEKILKDKVLRQNILSNQRERLLDFDYEKTKRELLSYLKDVINS